MHRFVCGVQYALRESVKVKGIPSECFATYDMHMYMYMYIYMYICTCTCSCFIYMHMYNNSTIQNTKLATTMLYV